MSGVLRVPGRVHAALLSDLRRRHAFAGERIAFCKVRLGNHGYEPMIALVTEFWTVPDEQYIDDPGAGARINAAAIRRAMQEILNDDVGILHVHLHELPGRPDFGRMDRAEIPRLVESFRATNPARVHGMLVLSPDSAEAWLAFPNRPLEPARKIAIVGRPMTLIGRPAARADATRFLRQSFLGSNSEAVFATVRVAIVGLGGGGSHIAQQLAHLGVLDYVLFDEQRIEDSNLNRLVGANEADIEERRLKVEIAARVIRGVRATASVRAVPSRWQEAPELLRTCDIVFGCVDGFSERRQIEASARRYLIPYVDIGMDVRSVEGQPPRMAGQVILSLPGGRCMHCLGFLNERNLKAEAQRYGDAGDHPQVVWANGVLASTAVGLGVELLTSWAKGRSSVEYLSYDGNLGTVTPHVRLQHLRDGACTHHAQEGLGDPLWGSHAR